MPSTIGVIDATPLTVVELSDHEPGEVSMSDPRQGRAVRVVQELGSSQAEIRSSQAEGAPETSYREGFVVVHGGEYIGRMDRVIGQGAMGTVRSFLLRRRSSMVHPTDAASANEIEVAVKAVRADFTATTRATLEKDIAREASAAFAIGRHALIASLIRMVVPLPGVESTATSVLLLIDFADAGDLELMMGCHKHYRQGRLYSEDGQARWPLSSVSLQIYLAFHHIHACGVLHQDFKPANLMMCSNGLVKVTDFGLADFAEQQKSVLCVPYGGGTYQYLSPQQVRMWKADAKGDAVRIVTPATCDLWQAAVTVLEMYRRSQPVAPDSRLPAVVHDCIARKPEVEILAMTPTRLESWLVEELDLGIAEGISQKMLDGGRVLALARGNVSCVMRELGVKTGSAKLFQVKLLLAVSTLADAIPNPHEVTDMEGTVRQCGISLVLSQCLGMDVSKRPATSLAVLELLGAEAKLDGTINLSLAAGFNVLPPSASVPVENQHEDEDVDSTYRGLVALFEGHSELQLAMNMGASWLAVLSHENTDARACALDAYCGLWVRHAENIKELALSPRANWRVENFNYACFERIAHSMWSSGHAPSRLTSIDLSHLGMINGNVLELLLGEYFRPFRQQPDPEEGFGGSLNPGIPTLEMLNLNSCQLPGVIPSAGLIGCPRLRELDLGGCSFTGPALDKVMAALRPASESLEKLNLGGSKIGGSIPAAVDMAHFTALSELQLYGMDLTGHTLSEALERLRPLSPTLKVLSLFGNKLGGTFPNESLVNEFACLTVLHLSYMDLSGLASAQAFAQLKALKELNLYGNDMLGCDLNALEKVLSGCTICCDTVDKTDNSTMWKRLNVDPEKARRALQFVQVAAITLAMGLLEANDPVLLIVFAISMGLIGASNVYLWGKNSEGGVLSGCAGVTVVFLTCAIILYGFGRTVRRIEGMERCHKLYRETHKLILGELRGSKLGPLSRRTLRRLGTSESATRTTRHTSSTTFQHAKANLDGFDRQLIQRMACEAVPGRAFKVIGLRVMDLAQIREKVDLEHGGDLGSSSFLNVISCSIVVATMAELCAVCEVLNRVVSDQDNVSIHQIVNGFQRTNEYGLRQAKGTGEYRELKAHIVFEGVTCEIKVCVDAYLQIKKTADAAYDLCRSLSLVGPIRSDMTLSDTMRSDTSTSDAIRVHQAMPLGLHITLTVLRWFVAALAICWLGAYMTQATVYEHLVPDEPLGPVRFLLMLSLAAPYSVVCFVACDDLHSGAASHREFWTFTMTGVVLCILMSVLIDYIFLAILSFFLLHMAAAVASARWGIVFRQERTTTSRVAALYDHYLGINGTHFVWKVVAIQLTSVVLQATAKLEIFLAVVWMSGHANPYFNVYRSYMKPLFWTFVVALVINAVYPAALLLQPELRSSQRNLVAALDVLLDAVYFMTFGMATVLAGAYPIAIPTTAYLYLSTFMPLLHIVAVARSIETAAAQNVIAAKKGVDHTKQAVPRRWAAALYVTLALSGIAAAFAFANERGASYPFGGDWDHPCRPCVCDDDGVLTSCAIPAKLMMASLSLHDAEITGIAPSVFGAKGKEDHRHLKYLLLNANSITRLRPRTFTRMPHLTFLDISSNNLTLIESDAFLGLDSLRSLVLRDNPFLTTLKDGALEGLDQLHLMFLDDCDRLRKIETGAFADTPLLKYVWMPDLNCSSRIVPWMPTGATCVGEYCSVKRSVISYFGNGICEEPKIGHTPGCMRDGGDCD